MDRGKARPEPRSTERASPMGAGWYVINQGREVRVEHADKTPSTAIEPGEKMIRQSGPYADQETARKVADRLLGKVERRPLRRKGRK